MAHEVTSWFQLQAESKISVPVRKFIMAGSDYSDRVMSWPSFKISWDEVRPVRLALNLANEDKALNYIRADKTNMQNSCALQIGFTHPTSGDELLNVFNGQIDAVKMSDGSVKLTLVDKFKTLAERVIGTSEIPVDYTTSNYLLSDIGWWICTSHGNLSSIESTSNPDIDYASFQNWAAVMSGDSVLVNARFTGMRVLEALRKVARVSQSAVFQEEDKIRFHRFSLVDSYGTILTKDEIIKTTLSIDDKDIVNRKLVMLDYDTTSRYHRSTVIDQNSSSVNSFGLREGVEKDAALWYVNSASALNFAQRDILVKKLPYDKMQVRTTLVGMLRSVGEMIYVSDEHLDISAEAYRVMNRSLSMGTGMVTFNGDASQLFGGFVLDTSSLDGNDVLT